MRFSHISKLKLQLKEMKPSDGHFAKTAPIMGSSSLHFQVREVGESNRAHSVSFVNHHMVTVTEYLKELQRLQALSLERIKYLRSYVDHLEQRLDEQIAQNLQLQQEEISMSSLASTLSAIFINTAPSLTPSPSIQMIEMEEGEIALEQEEPIVEVAVNPSQDEVPLPPNSPLNLYTVGRK